MYVEFIIRILTKKCSMGWLQGRSLNLIPDKKNLNFWLLTGDKLSTRNALKSSLCLLMAEGGFEWLSLSLGENSRIHFLYQMSLGNHCWLLKAWRGHQSGYLRNLGQTICCPFQSFTEAHLDMDSILDLDCLIGLPRSPKILASDLLDLAKIFFLYINYLNRYAFLSLR